MIVPITRTVSSKDFDPLTPVKVTLKDNLWHIDTNPTINIQTQLPSIKITKTTSDHQFALTLINLFVVNILDARRLLVVDSEEILYLVKPNESIIIPPLPAFHGLSWRFTLGNAQEPVLRFTFNSNLGKRKRT